MALTAEQLAAIRQKISRLLTEEGEPVDYVKSEVNLAIQSIEDWWELPATKSAISDAIDAATTFSFSNAQKKNIGKYWLDNKAERE